MKSSYKLDDFDYVLPTELIAQSPLDRRDSSRLLVLDKNSGVIKHKTFTDILDYIEKGDCLVINNTRVMPARLIGTTLKNNSSIEILLLNRKTDNVWETLVKPGKKARVGDAFSFSDILKAKVIEVLENGNRLIEFEFQGIWEEILDKLGQIPLPPYITKKLDDPEKYQTVYSKVLGSSAAPTAGLHFTHELMDKIEEKGAEIAEVTLHVGLGTFRPVKVANPKDHKMHSEFYEVREDSARKIREAKGRIIAVGTTSCRVLETLSSKNNIKATSGWTDIFIYPPYEFKVVDKLITNFHLPKSTLMMLVSSLAGYDNIMNAYKTAVLEKYRFFSFGDAMFIC
jgi:S-adenosylmethionine:tRNA ribosyltransferase-isomerase